jgi:hypothetical protein
MFDFNDIKAIEELGFLGFIKLGDLFDNSSIIPDIKGIYMILYNDNNTPEFLITGTGGHFKGKNPNISMQALKHNWIEDTKVVYIGKAGGDDSKATLWSRLTQYFRFGQGKNVGHWGWTINMANKEFQRVIGLLETIAKCRPKRCRSRTHSKVCYCVSQTSFRKFGKLRSL